MIGQWEPEKWQTRFTQEIAKRVREGRHWWRAESEAWNLICILWMNENSSELWDRYGNFNRWHREYWHSEARHHLALMGVVALEGILEHGPQRTA